MDIVNLAPLLALALGGCGGAVASEHLPDPADARGSQPTEQDASDREEAEATISPPDAATAAEHADRCIATQDGATLRITMGAVTKDCTNSVAPNDEAGPATVRGVVTEVTASSFTIDTCAPNADCSSSLTRFDLAAPGLEIPLMLSSFVEVDYHIIVGLWCTQAIEVKSLAEWGGVRHPATADHALLLSLVDGDVLGLGLGVPLPSSPYTVGREALACPADPKQDIAPGGWFALLFTPTNDPQGTMRVGMGETMSFALPTADGGRMTVRNLHSKSSGFEDDYANYAYYLFSGAVAR